jgi:hypothetical protein
MVHISLKRHPPSFPPAEVWISDMSGVLALLDELHSRWVSQGVPVQDLAPGASAAVLDAAEMDLGFQLSNEVRDWFTWSNGYIPAAAAPGPSRSWFRWPNLFHSISLEAAVRTHHECRADNNIDDERSWDEPVYDFGDHWINLTRPSKYSVIADCASAQTDPDAPSGLHYLDIMDPEAWQRVAVPSITELLQTWIQLISDGALWFDTQDHTWDYRYDATAHGFAWAATVLPWANPMLPRI